jgi:plasmid stabilization system protein ParE
MGKFRASSFAEEDLKSIFRYTIRKWGFDSLLIHHGNHRQFFGFHRLIAKTFPFSIYYRVVGETIFVDAVIDQRRNPESIRKHLERLEKEV